MSEELIIDVIIAGAVLLVWSIIFWLGMLTEAWMRNKVIDELEQELHEAQNRIDELEADEHVGI